MGWPIDKVWADAPGYSFKGQIAWPGASAKFDAWQAACAAFEDAARASDAATFTNSWASNGQNFTGPSTPATPANEFVYGAEGAARRYTSYLFGSGGQISIGLRFYKKKYTKEYRWVQDVAPVPATSCDYWLTVYYPNGSTSIDTTPPGDVEALRGRAATAAQVWVGVVHPSNPSKGPIVAVSWNYLQYGQVVGYTNDGTTILGLSSILQYGPYNGRDGQWHQEQRYVATSDTAAGSTTAYYDQSWNIDFGQPAPPTRSRHRFTTVEGTGLVRINTLCGSAAQDRFSTDIWDPSLTQAIIDSLNSPGFTLEGKWNEPIVTEFTAPGGNFVLTQGNSFLNYQEKAGAFVWDIQLKKWGKFKQQHSIILDYTPVNLPSSGTFTYTDLGMTAGVWKTGKMKVFDDEPTEGYIKYGRVGYYRLGMIHFLETRVDFRRPFQGVIDIEASLNGRTVDPSVTLTTTVTGSNTVVMYPNMRYKWYNIKISGKYDLQYMETRANVSSKR